jgi:hypothetical protein
MLKNLKSDDLEVTCDPKWIELYSKGKIFRVFKQLRE